MPSGNVSCRLLNFNGIFTSSTLFIYLINVIEFRNERPSCHMQEFKKILLNLRGNKLWFFLKISFVCLGKVGFLNP